MNRFINKIQGPRAITFFYFFLLLYTIAALLWWGILLHNQSGELSATEIKNLALKIDSLQKPVEYQVGLQQIHRKEELRTWMYLGEGATFLLVILLGAAYVYRAVRKQIRLSNQQHNFMMAVTHELKSPITVARLNLETLLKRKLDEDTQRNLLEKTLRETNRLNHLCNNMLLASQFESRQYHLVKEVFDFSRMLLQCVEEIKTRISTHVIKGEIIPDVWVKGDQLMLQIAVNNLVENAAKYSPKASEIHIRLSSDVHKLLLQIADSGGGIPDDEKEKVFIRFYRIGNENTRKTKGTGLGLFLTKKIVEQHAGEIKVADNVPKGSIFEIIMPRFMTDKV